MKLLIFGLSTLALMSCQSKEKTRTPALIGGSLRADGARSTLALIPSNSKHDRCSATLVKSESRKIIITAAHCLHWWNKNDRVDVARTVVTDNGEGRVEAVARIKDVQIHPDYRHENKDNLMDIAVAILDRELPADLTPIALAPADWTPSKEGKVLLVGAGTDEADFTKQKFDSKVRTGEYRSGLGVVRSSNLKWVADLLVESPPQRGDLLEIRAVTDGDSYPCRADSGGSLLENSVLVGVLAKGAPRPINNRTYCWHTGFTNPMGAVPVAPFREWIDAHIAEFEK